MKRLIGPVILFTALISHSVDGRRGLNAWERQHVVPDAVDVVPRHKLSIRYDTGAEVNFGNVLTPTQVRNHPKFSWNADPRKLYVLCFMDLDVPSRRDPSKREFLHYLVGNIPGNDVIKGEVLAHFMGSGPQRGTGLHRYVFLVFEQRQRLRFTERRLRLRGGNIYDRENFSTRNFARKYRLGDPIAGNFYQSEWDETVDKLMAEWTELSKMSAK